LRVARPKRIRTRTDLCESSQRTRFTQVCSAIVASRTKSLAFRTSNPEHGGITGLPILPLSIERLKPPPRPGPVGSDTRIAVVDFVDQLRHRLPAEVKCDLCSNVQIDSCNKQVSSGTNQSCYVAKTPFGIGAGHVAEKIARDYHVLRPKNV